LPKQGYILWGNLKTINHFIVCETSLFLSSYRETRELQTRHAWRQAQYFKRYIVRNFKRYIVRNIYAQKYTLKGRVRGGEKEERERERERETKNENSGSHSTMLRLADSASPINRRLLHSTRQRILFKLHSCLLHTIIHS
jgi:hypothetical protein